MKLFNIKNLFFVLALGFAFLNSNFVLADACTDVCPAGKTCSFLPTCKTGCNTGCQPGYYLSDGDGDPRNNCLGVGTDGICNNFNTKGVCEICPVGFYCKGGMIDKIPCPPGKYTDKIGSTKQLDCVAPPAGYCVAKAMVIGTGTGSVPSVCIETPMGGVSSTEEKDISGAINSQMANDVGIKGYTENNNIGANIAIPCPLGTYSTAGGSKCLYPSKGYCASYDGVNCVISDQYKGMPKSMDDDLNNAIVTALGKVNSDTANPVTALGATKQAKCPLGTYDLRTKFGTDYNKPAPFCIYPDVGYSTGNTPGSSTQTECAAGKYDSRYSAPGVPSYNTTTHVFTPYSTIPGTFLADQPNAECVSCPIGTYQSESGKAYCIYPPAGKYAPTTGISKLDGLSTCSAGSYDSRSTYSFMCKTNNTKVCKTNADCPSGDTCNTGGNITWTNITDAIIGESEILNYTSGKISTSCIACPVGTYQGSEGQVSCNFPDVGNKTTTTSTGNTSQTPCPKGSYDGRSEWNDISKAFIEINNSSAEKTPNTICDLCPVGTFQGSSGQAKCEYPEALACSALEETSGACSEQTLGAKAQILCKDISSFMLGEEVGNFYDPRNGNVSAPNPNCSGCQESDYTDWDFSYVDSKCQSNNKWEMHRTAKKVGDWSRCEDTVRYDFGSCNYCTAHSNCGTEAKYDYDNECGDDCDYPTCSYGYSHREYDSDYNNDWCKEECISHCYYQCDLLGKNYCTNVASKCDSGYRIDGTKCIKCSVPAGFSNWTNPGVSCDYTCNSGYMKTNYNNVPSCQICSNVPVSGMGTYTYMNPGVSCDWKCNAGYVKTNDNNIPNCRSCGSLTSNASWIDPGLSCDFKCNAGYYKVDGKCVSCDGFYTTRASNCVWSPNSNIICSNLTSCSYTCPVGFLASGYSCIPCGGLSSGASNWLYAGNCTAIDCKPGYTLSSNQCISCSISLPLNASWSTKNSCNYVCNPGFTLSNGQCIACSSALPANANWIPKDNNNSYCNFACNPGFTLSNGQCIACTSSLPANAIWTTQNSCNFTCNPGFTLSNGQCVACTYNPYLQANSSYTTNNSCDFTCNPGYKKDTYGTCANCGSLPLNAYWTTKNSCNFSCNKGYKLSSSGQCVSCGTLPTGALYWTTENSCDVYCDSGYKPSGDKCVSCGTLPVNASNWTGNGGCYADCKPGYYIDGNNFCQTCGNLPANALSWNKKNTCSFDCKNGYQPSGSQCVACGSPSSVLPTNAHWVTQCSWICDDGYIQKLLYGYSYKCELN